MVSDFRYIGPIKEMVDCLKKYQPQLATFYYHFGHTGSHSLCDKGKYLTEFFFFAPFKVQNNKKFRTLLSENDKEISKKLIRMWTNFAHSANPTNSQDKFHWASVKSEDVDLEYVCM